MVGDVITSYQQDPFLRRTVLVATFSDTRSEIRERVMLPGLFDARCVLIVPEGMMLAGIERVQIDGVFVEYAQGWWLRPVEEETRSDAKRENQEGCGADYSSHRQSAGSWARRLKY